MKKNCNSEAYEIMHLKTMIKYYKEHHEFFIKYTLLNDVYKYNPKLYKVRYKSICEAERGRQLRERK